MTSYSNFLHHSSSLSREDQERHRRSLEASQRAIEEQQCIIRDQLLSNFPPSLSSAIFTNDQRTSSLKRLLEERQLQDQNISESLKTTKGGSRMSELENNSRVEFMKCYMEHAAFLQGMPLYTHSSEEAYNSSHSSLMQQDIDLVKNCVKTQGTGESMEFSTESQSKNVMKERVNEALEEDFTPTKGQNIWIQEDSLEQENQSLHLDELQSYDTYRTKVASPKIKHEERPINIQTLSSPSKQNSLYSPQQSSASQKDQVYSSGSKDVSHFTTFNQCPQGKAPQRKHMALVINESLDTVNEDTPDFDQSVQVSKPHVPFQEITNTALSTKAAAASKNQQQKQLIEKQLAQLVESFDQGVSQENALDSSQVEELILEMHRLTKQNGGTIPSNLQTKLAKVQRDLQFKALHGQKKESYVKGTSALSTQSSQLRLTSQDEGESYRSAMGTIREKPLIPNFIEKSGLEQTNPHLYDSILKEYSQSNKAYQTSLQSINIKKISSFKSIKAPSQSDRLVGVGFVLLFSYCESQIILTNDKSTLQDKSWNGSVVKHFSNCGKVIQNLKKIKELIEGDRISPNIVKELVSMYNGVHEHEVSPQARDLMLFMRNVIEAIDLNRRSKEIVTQINTKPQELKVRSVAHEIPQPKDVPLRPIVEIQPHYDQLRYEVNKKIYAESVQFDKEMKEKEELLQQTKRFVKDLRSKENIIKWKLERKQKNIRKVQEKEELKSHQEYENQMRQQFLVFLKDRLDRETAEKQLSHREQTVECRLRKLKDDTEHRIIMLEEFKKTLDQIEEKEMLRDEVRQQRLLQHAEFVEKMSSEKVFRQECYAAHRIIQHEERKTLRKRELEFEHERALREQAQIMEDIELLIRSNQ